jgi:uridine kinase
MKRTECLSELAALIVAIDLNHPTRVALDGVDGVGKTALADELVGPIRQLGRTAIRASTDGFHNARLVRHRRGLESPEGYFLDSFDYPSLRSQLLDPLGPNGTRRFRRAVFDYRIDAPTASPPAEAGSNDILLFDGVFLLRPELVPCWDLSVWLEAPFDITLQRALRRDVVDGQDAAAVRSKYEHRYVAGQLIYLNQCRPREQANIVLHNTDFLNPELECRLI